MQILAVLLLVSGVISVTVLCAQVEEDEELDPFDMVNFDHANMRMRKKVKEVEKPDQVQPSTKEQKDEVSRKKSAAKEHQQSAGGTPQEDKVSEPVREAEPTPPKEDEIPESMPPSEQEQKSDAGKSCPAFSLFQQFVSRLLRFVGDKVSQMDTDIPTDMCLRLRLTHYQVDMLENFKRGQDRDSMFNAHDILNEAVQGVHVLNADDPSLRYLWVEKYFGVTLDKAQQILSFFTYVVVLAVMLPKVRLRWLLISGFWISVGMTWYRLYKNEVAKQHEALMKDMPAGCGGKPDEDRSFFSTIASYVRSQVTFQKDSCIAYYERLVTDPSVMVTPMEALAVALVQTMLKPLRTVGTEISEFLRALVKDLPVQWQFISVIIVCTFFTLILLLICGYRLRIPLLLSIEPSHSDRAHEIKALNETISHLQAAIRNTDTAHQRPPQVCDTVGSMPLDAPSAASAIAPVAKAREGVATNTTRCRQHPLRPLANPEELASKGNRQPVQGEETLRTDVRQTAVFEDGDDPCGMTLTKTVQTSRTAVERMVPAEVQSGYNYEVDCSTLSFDQAVPDVCEPPPPVDIGCSQRVPETLGAVEVGQSGDADRAKPVSLAEGSQ